MDCLDVQFLQDAGLYENQQEAVSREEVLGRLDQVEFMLLVAYVNSVDCIFLFKGN